MKFVREETLSANIGRACTRLDELAYEFREPGVRVSPHKGISRNGKAMVPGMTYSLADAKEVLREHGTVLHRKLNVDVYIGPFDMFP